MSVSISDARRPLARIRDLSIGFRQRGVTVPAVEHVSFDVWPGRVHALVGESGSGKSVSARALVGLNGRLARTEAKELTYRGKDVRRFGAYEWRAVRGRQIGLVLQDALQSLDPLRTVGREIAEALGTPRLRLDDELLARIADLLTSVGIPDAASRIDQYSYQLSGGLRQRVLIAAAIARNPRLIIADEPTTALDTTIQKEIITLLRSAVQDDVGLLLISHDLSLVAEIADTVSVLERGSVVEEGDTTDVLTRPAHPYTRKLLRAVPSAQARGRRLSVPTAAVAESVTAEAPPARRIGEVVLSGHALRKTFVHDGHARVALDGVSFTLRDGETLGVVGESGSGKTTLLRTILGLSTPDAGEVRLGETLWNPSPERDRRPRRSDLQLVSQDPLGSFDPRYSAERLILDGARVSGLRGDGARRRATELADAVGLTAQQVRRNPRELSGGQRQRVAIARALAAQPRILVCDEPVSALDVSVQAQVLDLLHDLRQAFGTSIVFVSHDLGVIYHVSDRVLVLKDGIVVETGDVVEVYRDPQHPYTQRLLDAVPKLATASARAHGPG
ncbi:ABC transporter ATP-binding protein [Microbacterium sp. 18062]|uniref:dipeptide ABC transporter ATP-binding protein n=1 Tax=Microbacterium sp. 18062 TaxID=2681410 RepID=UPI00135C69BB|nr:ABC transporter ATP-binding protein [Microbacterium sp. 18062]